MKTPPENEFPELRRLLALKRHEQPPPGYFNNLSREIVAELKVDRARPVQVDSANVAPEWLSNLMEWARLQPGLAGVYGALMCALIGGGILLLGDSKPSNVVFMPSLMNEAAKSSLEGTEPLVVAAPVVFEPVTADSPMLAQSNTLQGRPSLFDSMPMIAPATVNHRP